jgi:release factor glutamine methyltransferase
MTIQEAIRYSRDQLKKIYEEGEAAAISDWLTGHLAGAKKTKQQLLTTEQASLLEIYIQRLLTHEPIQYVLNEAWFCGLKFYVDRNVLIPRPETEELVEWIITNCRFPVDKLSIFDIGSGSGCIPISLKRRIGKAEVWSCDISPEALDVAKRNAATLGAGVNFIEIDFLSREDRDKLPSFDIIVSNPPYVPQKDKAQMQPNVLQYEPHTALFVPDNDLLLFYKAMADFGEKHLNRNGNIYAELHESTGSAAELLFQSKGYTTEIKKDMQGKERMLRAVKI